MLIIGLNGRLRSGKDTAYDYLNSVYGRTMSIRREGFADRMKLSGVRALGFDPKTVEDAVAIANYIKESCTVDVVCDNVGQDLVQSVTGRAFWQRYGTESHREVFGENFWVDALLPIIPTANGCILARDMPGVNVLIVTDVRFPNEAIRIRDLGGEVWRIDADKRLGPLPSGSHISEFGLDDSLVSRVVGNDGTVEDFQDNLVAAFEGVAPC